jgi:hypothetical protein
MIRLGWLIIVVNFAVIIVVAWSSSVTWLNWVLLVANASVIVLTLTYSLPVARRQLVRERERERASRP